MSNAATLSSGFNLKRTHFIDHLPESWKSMGFGKCVIFIRNGCSSTQVDESETTVPVTRIETISIGVINTEKVGHVEQRDIDDKYQLQKGDIQFSNINSLSMIGNCAKFSSDGILYAGMNLLQIRPNTKTVTPHFMHWQMSSSLFRGMVEASAKPAINQASIPSTSLRQLPFIVPPTIEQKQIAAFLDYETAKIDALIEKQQQLIALLGEKRQAVISHAVTKGLNPDVPMRDSGVEWLGEVPAHWDLKQIGHVASVARGTGYQNVEEIDESNEAIQMIRISDFNTFSPIWVDKENSLKPYLVDSRDVLIAGTGASAGITMRVTSDMAGMIHSYNAPRIRCTAIVADYLYFVLNSHAIKQQEDVLFTGSAQHFLDLNAISKLKFFVPDEKEQLDIVSYLHEKMIRFDSLESKTTEAVHVLQERRTALISAAVTGKIDVRNWQPPTDDKPQKPNKEAA